MEINAAVVPGSNALLPGETPAGDPAGESAEAIVMNSKPGVKTARLNTDTGRLDAMKGQTEQGRTDPVEDIEADDAGKGEAEMRAATDGRMGTFRSRP